MNEDGSMMQIEVPRDQYDQACELMQKRIDSGQVPDAQPGDDPRKYVKKGTFTYASAHNIAASGTIESLCVDLGTGIITSSIPTGISVVIVFSIAIWNGEKPAEAAKAGLVTGLKVFGKGALIYTLTIQLSRSKLAISLTKTYFQSGEFKDVATIANPAFAISEKVASSVSTSALAKSSIGKSIRLDKVTGQLRLVRSRRLLYLVRIFVERYAVEFQPSNYLRIQQSALLASAVLYWDRS